MKIAVIGAGIIGVTCAYELARDGHEVTVYERHGAAAEEASFANAGVLAPGNVAPWAAPGLSWRVAKQWFNRHRALRLKLPLSYTDLTWLWQFWRACNTSTYTAQRTALVQLALLSRTQLHAISERHGLEYERSSGYLIALRSEKEQAMAASQLGILRELGISAAHIDEAAARKIEPSINPDTRFAGAIHLPNDEVANCRQFALLLKDECKRMGVQFEFSTSVCRLETQAHGAHYGVTVHATRDLHSATPHLRTDPLTAAFDAAVLCSGTHTRALLAAHAARLPLRPVYGYCISAQIKEALNAPRSGLLDERYQVSITRLGQRLRIAGGAQIGGRYGQMNTQALETLYKVLHDWFPGAAIMGRGIQTWQGARPMMSNRPPVIGRLHANAAIWLNTGHGPSGWALACGSARLLADQIAGHTPPIDPSAFSSP